MASLAAPASPPPSPRATPSMRASTSNHESDRRTHGTGTAHDDRTDRPGGGHHPHRRQVAELSTAKTPPVVVTIGERSARLRVARMGGAICIGMSKAARAQLGVEIGDEVDAKIALDDAERTVDVPADLAAALDADAQLRAAFEALSYTRRKEIAAGVAGAKRDETRRRRIEAAIADLRQVR